MNGYIYMVDIPWNGPKCIYEINIQVLRIIGKYLIEG